ncbi:MAG: sensory box histidine kinase/response regulator [Candidatus Ozemobacter sibiricus]|jgi:PAS domain S-box-containing protein|uniref:histidine kinase n=1 Tax=Candidatus Ozemobacter sibiricus TaxID=2268124 RepID=A0A367ZTA5_9BACT|nr:MAG: sensory box histidine kinase/response regulator [Candidatus Ozemobacter sibiricus]
MTEHNLPPSSPPWALIAIAGLASLLIALGGYLFFRQEEMAIRQARQAELKAIADLKTASLLAWRRERLTDVAMNASGILRLLLTQWLAEPSAPQATSELLARLTLFCQGEGYRSMIIARPDGTILLSNDPHITCLDEPTKEVVRRAVGSGGPALGDLYRCQLCQGVHIDVAALIAAADGNPLGVLIARSDPEAFLFPLIQSWPTPSPTSETLLVRREGEHVVFLNRLRHIADAPLTKRVPLTAIDVPAVQAVLGRSGVFEGRDYRDIEVLADLRPIPDSPWFMVAKVDRAEMLAELEFRRRSAIVFVLLLVALVTGAAFLTHARQQRQLLLDLLQTRQERDAARDETRAVLYGIGDAIIATDQEGRVTRMNRVAETLTGWTENEARGRPLPEIFRIVHEQTRQPVEDPTRRVLREGLIVNLAQPTLLIARDGTARPIADSGAPVRGSQGEIIGAVLVFRDQTAERAAQRRLAESEERFRLLFESAPDAVFVVTDGNFAYLNPAAVRLFGADCAEALVDTPFVERVAPDTREGATSLLKKSGPGPGVSPLEQTYRRLDGTPVPVEATAIRILFQGRPSHLVFARDITEKQLREQERATMERKLRQAQKMESVGRLAGGIAHDFNNLLTAITGYAEFLFDSLPVGDARREDVRQILSAGERAASLTRQLLAFSRQQILTPQTTDLNGAVGNMARLLTRLIGEDIHLETRLAPAPCRIRIDPSQLDQILVNLAVNARDAMPNGGRLIIGTRVLPPTTGGTPRLPSLGAGALVELSVSDTGYGMGLEIQERLFEPFFTTKEAGKGSGLGLATVYGIVKQSGGEIECESQPGRGTTFRIYFPEAAGEPLTVPAASPTATEARPGHETILLVEDEDLLRRLTERVLQGHGYAVQTAASGEAALRLVATLPRPVDLLITDVVMPGMDGRTLAKAVHQQGKARRVLYISGYTDDAIVRHGVLEPGLAFLYKPFTPAGFLRKVREVLDGPADQARP